MKNNQHKGFAVVTVLIMVVVFSVMLASYFFLTRIQLSTATAKVDRTTGFYSAEGALNIRGQNIMQEFVGFNRPDGTSPSESSQPCKSNNVGDGSFGCITHTDIPTNNRNVQSYIIEDAANPQDIEISNGTFNGLTAQEYRYDVFAEAFNTASDLPEARLQMRFRSRLVPLFQFAAFYEGDLEIAPGAPMTLSGRVHTNSNLYLGGGGGTLNIRGKVSSGGSLFGGRKYRDTNPCYTGNQVNIPTNAANGNYTMGGLPCKNNGYTNQELNSFNVHDKYLLQNVSKITIPKPEILDPDPTNQQKEEYWERADLRIVLKLNASNSPVGIEVQNANGTLNAAATTRLNSSSCNTPVSTSNTFYNHREAKTMRLLDVDATKLLACIGTDSTLVNGGLADTTHGGLVMHFSVDGPDSSGINNYGVRMKNGKTLDSRIKGLTVVTNQAMYVQGDYNSPNDQTKKKPASFLADSLNVLSNSWNDENSGKPKTNRVASTTTINAAFLAGADKTVVTSATGNSTYNGGLENYPRLHESWTQTGNRKLRLRGSFVSLGEPKHVNGAWSRASYDAPERDWDYDTDFNNAGKLPPLSPRFVYLVQEFFTRDFERKY
jgi:hypothetical protein